MENCMIEEPDRSDAEEYSYRSKHDDCMAGECDCPLCVICERSECRCVCDEMPAFDDVKIAYDDEAAE